MNLYKLIAFIVLLTGCDNCVAQNYFEGGVVYKVESRKKDSAFDLTNIPSYPSTKLITYFKSGHWISLPNAGIVEYQYFNGKLNRIFYKLRNQDTLFYEDYAEQPPYHDSIISTRLNYNTDTILGKICHQFVINTSSLKLTFVFSPDLKVDPSWFANTKGGYYNIIFENTKAVYLKCIVESEGFISVNIAEKILPPPVPDSKFPDLNKTSFRPLRDGK
jgi:hypothetical protein